MNSPGVWQGPPAHTGKGNPSCCTGRLTTRPKAPSASCCKSNTTARAKEGSVRVGRAMRNEQARQDMLVVTLLSLGGGPPRWYRRISAALPAIIADVGAGVQPGTDGTP